MAAFVLLFARADPPHGVYGPVSFDRMSTEMLWWLAALIVLAPHMHIGTALVLGLFFFILSVTILLHDKN